MSGLIDIMLGRWPVKESKEQNLVTIAQKTINYEKYPTLGDWRRDGLLTAGDGDGMIHFDNFITLSKPFFLDIGYDTMVVRYSQINDPELFAHRIQNWLDNGTFLTVYNDHGGPEAWWHNYDTADVKILNNASRLPVILSYACLTAMFQWDNPFYEEFGNYPSNDSSIAEVFLINSNGGAVAFFGATEYTTLDSIKQLEMLHQLFHCQNWTLGKFLFPGLDIGCRFVSEDSMHYMYCLLGDPALDLGDYTANPNMPDLVIRQRALDVVLDKPFPYQVNGDLVPIDVSVWNIGKVIPCNVKVKARVKVPLFSDTATIGTINIPFIQSKDSVTVRFMWDPTVYNFDDGGTIVLPDGYYGNIGESKFFFIADPYNEIAESWEGNNTTDTLHTVVLYPQGWSRKCPYLTLEPESGVPALTNVDATGSVEIVFPGLDSLYIIKTDGQNYPNWPKYFHEVYGIALADLDNNGFSDIIAVSEESLKVYMNFSGLFTLAWSATAPDGKYTGLPAIGRIQLGSGFKDIVVLLKPLIEQHYYNVLVYDYDGNSPIYTWSTVSPALNDYDNAGPSIANVNVSGNNEVTVSYYSGVGNKTEIFNAAALHQILNYGNGKVTPALALINADLVPDVLAGANASVLHAYDANNSLEIWQTSGGAVNIFNSPAVGDIYGGSQYPGVEITCDRNVPATGYIRLFKRSNGSDILPWPISVNQPISTSPALAKLEGSSDRNVDIVFGSKNYRLYGVNYLTDTIPPFALPVFGIPNSAVVGDIDGDHKSETVFSSSDGYLHVWKNVNSYVSTYQLEWPQFHHDYQRTGLYNWVGGLLGGDANPPEFSTSTTISMTLQEQSRLNLKIYDVEGNLVKALVDQVLPAGTYNPTWDGKGDNFTSLPNGIYFIEIEIQNESMVIPVTINR